MITFDCGGAATISITSQKELPKGKDTTIDGGTLQGANLFHSFQAFSLGAGVTVADLRIAAWMCP